MFRSSPHWVHTNELDEVERSLGDLPGSIIFLLGLPAFRVDTALDEVHHSADEPFLVKGWYETSFGLRCRPEGMYHDLVRVQVFELWIELHVWIRCLTL